MKPLGRRLTLTLLTAALALLAIAPLASADVTTRYPIIASFGPDGTAATTFATGGQNAVYPLAFDQANDRLYVLDRHDPGGPLIYAFDIPSRTPVGGAFPLTVPAADSNFPPMAVDNSGGASAGNLYYVAADRNIYGFESDGTPLGGAFPVATGATSIQSGGDVDASGNIFISNFPAGVIRKFSPAGALLATIPAVQGGGGPRQIALDSAGNLFVDQANVGVYRYDAPGYDTATQIAPSGSLRLGLDRTNDHLYLARGFTVSVHDTASGAFAYDFRPTIPGASLETVAIDEGTGAAYAGDSARAGTDSAFQVHVLPPAQSFADATATPTAPANVTGTSAELAAEITENSPLTTAWRLELSTDGGTSWETVGSGTTSGREASIAATGPDTGTLTVAADGGTYTLTYDGLATAPLAHDAPAATVQSALEGLASIGAGNVTVSGGPGDATGSSPYQLEFTGALDGTAVTEIASDPAALHHPPSEVTATAGGLDPNTEYEFRAVTNKGSDPSTEVATAPLSFSTLAVPPELSDLATFRLTDTSTHLVGTVDPRNSLTTYRFDYGTTPAADQLSTPTVEIGSGLEPITVAPLIEGLTPDTDYFFKLIATNPAGTVESAAVGFHTRADPPPPIDPGDCANAALREAQGSTYLASCRAYELVSPPDKNQGGVDVAPVTPRAAISPDGQSVAFCTSMLFGEPAGAMTDVCAPYISRRGAAGWQTAAPFPRTCGSDPGAGEFGVGFGMTAYLSPDFRHAALSLPESDTCPLEPLDPAAPRPAANLYRQDLGPGGPGLELLSPNQSVPYSGRWMAVLGDDDFSHLAFVSTQNQTEPPDSPAPGDFNKVYGRSGGSLELLSVDPDGDPFATPSALPARDPSSYPNQDAVSADGERVYFQNPAPAGKRAGCRGSSVCDLYLREGGEQTFEVSASECTVDCGAGDSADNFLWASEDGATAIFASCEKLTDASAPTAGSCAHNDPSDGQPFKLYRWDREAAPGSRLTDLSVDQEPADGSQPGFLGFFGASEDGETAYFAAKGQIVAGEDTAPGTKLYRWRHNGGSPQVEYLEAMLDGPFPGDTSTIYSRWAELNNWGWISPKQRVSADGSVLLISTETRVLPAVDRDPDADLYRWAEGEGWACVSCQLPGAPSAGHASDNSIPLPALVEPLGRSFDLNHEDGGVTSQDRRHIMSEDGSRVFFHTPEALVPEDTNGEAGCPFAEWPDFLRTCTDVYEWHDGTLSLISGGADSRPSWLIGTSASGEEVLFATRERLVGFDTDNQYDYYTAHIEGGFPEPEPVPAPCEGEGCRGQGSDRPADLGAATAQIAGEGNPTFPPDCSRFARQTKRLSRQARSLRSRASKLRRAARRSSSPQRSKAARRGAKRLATKAKKRSRAARQQAARAKRCRRAAR